MSSPANQLSLNNSSNTPILANGIFFGQTDNVLAFCTAVITVTADTQTQLTVFQSQLGLDWNSTVYQIPANTPTSFDIPITLQYLYVQLDNLDGAVDQTFLSLSTIYRNVVALDISGASLTGTVTVSNQPPFQFSGGLLEVSGCSTLSGSVAVSNQPPFVFDGSLLAVDISGAGRVTVTNLPAFHFDGSLLGVNCSGSVSIFDSTGANLLSNGNGRLNTASENYDGIGNAFRCVGSDPNYMSLLVEDSRMAFDGSLLAVDVCGQTYVSGNLKVYDSNTSTIANSSLSVTLWNNEVAYDTCLSAPATLNTSWSLASMSVFGNSTCPSGHRLQVMMSNDNTNYYGSQYVYSLTSSGDFGFNLPNTGANYLAMRLLDNSSTLTAYLNARP